MASSSPNKRTKNMASSSFFPLDDLPDEILVEIFACVAEAIPTTHPPLHDLHNIRGVSRKFRHLAFEKKVLQRAALDDDRAEWNGQKWYEILHSNNFRLYESLYEKFLARCDLARNPQVVDAVFQLGVTQFFASGEGDIELQERGLRNVKFALDGGHEDAAEVYGVFLITLGVQEGYQILAPFRIELNPIAVRNLQVRWKNYFDVAVWWRPWPERLEYIRNTYVPGNCQCDGLTSVWLRHASWWHLSHLPTSMACEVCQWHYVIYATGLISPI